MGKILRRGQAGNAAQYLTRNQALKKLQLKLSEFRRLCILKGIHPREPRKKPHGRHRTYYHAKDIGFLAHEPLLAKFREDVALERRVRRARAKGNPAAADRLAASRPAHRLDHLVRERYPTLADALRDLDDPLTLVHLFAALAADERAHIPRSATAAARALALEWQAWVARTHALRKCFISVKGYYFQADVAGTPVTWLVPHALAQVVPPDVDCRVMLTFLELGATLLRFVHYRLYASAGLAYPPAPDAALDAAAAGLDSLMRGLAAAAAAGNGEALPAPAAGPADKARRAALPAKLAALAEAEKAAADDDADDAVPGSIDSGDDGEDDEGPAPATPGTVVPVSVPAAAPPYTSTPAAAHPSPAAARLFKGLTFHLGREVPREPLLLVIRAFGGGVAWDGPGSPTPPDSPAITHAVVDRPTVPGGLLPGRTYVQPQWVFDSANFRVRADERKYAPGLTPPPHLSPFAEAGADGGYVPAYAAELAALREAAATAVGGGGAADQAAHVASFEPDAAAVGGGGAGAAPAAPAALVDPAAAAERAHAEGLAKELGLKAGGGGGAPAVPAAPVTAAANTDDADAVALRKSLLPRKKRNLYESVAKNQAAKAARGAALAARKAELDAACKK